MILCRLVTNAEGSPGVRFTSAFVCLSNYLHDFSETAADMISKLDIEMFHHESWRPIYFRVKSSKSRSPGTKKTLPAWVVALSELASSSSNCDD